ncbi:transcriptional regulator [Clostridium botulinum]|uniref:HTH cro/C1-type domain-containing protein n=1 Tax=Clostridium botulinum TaxID=1491 RepID=A0A126JI42_CLOBO|nr:helix-turn-helix transcriptional regulator [Clostridium botulinum]ALT05457.1 Helix-turn-helix XRE-family hypothetical protein [Clostridium botulinum]ALT05555.1 Helix-turn-helix XRE-family hypothetical protein [Clostridium botulinum]MBY6810981.1 transcriptional regulator [Clostridium botulinum]MBY6818458.1 transcriptional regulator [Clostridium botulinum]MBY6824449.1 transcriptional regulator [Clostridium botulinum]
MNTKLFSERLREYLQINKMSQGQLGKVIGQTTSSITRYLNLERIPNEATLIKMAYHLNVNPNYLCGKSNNPKTHPDIKEQYVTVCEEELLRDKNLSLFSKRLQILTHEKEKKYVDVANDLNISKGVISNYVNDKRQPDLEGLKNICRYFDVSSDYLLGLSYSKNAGKEYEKYKNIIDDLIKTGILDKILKNGIKNEIFVELLKHTYETFEIIQSKY